MAPVATVAIQFVFIEGPPSAPALTVVITSKVAQCCALKRNQPALEPAVCRRIGRKLVTARAKLTELRAALPAWLDDAAIRRICRRVPCRYLVQVLVQVPALVAPVIRAQSVE